MVTKVILNKVAVLLIVAGCSVKNPEWIESIKKDDYSMVKIGVYPYMEAPMKDDTPIIAELREKIENYPEIISKIIHHFYSEESQELDFKFIRAFVHKDEIMLRYFSRFQRPEIFAGYSIQFVTTDGVIKGIYLFKVPLE